MKILYDEENKRLTVIDCFSDAVEIYKDGVSVFDIPLENGTGFVTNQENIVIDDSLEVFPYNRFVIATLIAGENEVAKPE